MIVLTVVLLYNTLWLQAVAAPALQCSSQPSKSFNFKLTSSRNETGHWIAKVQFEHKGDHNESGPWEVDVDHVTTKCRDGESIIIVASITESINTSTASNGQCFTSFTFSLNTSRDRRGEWTTQVQLEHKDDETSLPWNVKVDHTTAKCDSTENVGIIATISGDCSTGVFDIAVSSFCTDTVRPGPEYELVRGLGYYKVHTAAESWDDARKICITEGTHLLILNSGAEMDAVKTLWSKQPNFTMTEWQNYIHVGAHDLYKEGEYVTILDQPLKDAGYDVWDNYEPNNAGGNENCMSVKNTGGLNDVFCGLKLAFICEREL